MLKIILAIILACAATHHAACAQAVRWVQTKTAVAPSGRLDAAMVYDGAREQVVLFGGRDRVGNMLADTWTLEGNVWSLRNPTRVPPATEQHAMAYDQARQEVVLFGGYYVKGNVVMQDTWTWNGRNWTQKFPVTKPGRLLRHAMAYDSSRQYVLLFGGSSTGARGNQTWIWSGKSWTRVTPKTVPSARRDPAMAYDSVRKRVVMLGGYGQMSSLAETWTWNGKTWTLQTPNASPPVSTYQSMAYDQVRQVVVLFCAGPKSSSTWTWDGKTWTQLRSQLSPQGLGWTAMAYDSKRKEIVLFDGWTGTTWKLVAYTATAKQFGSGCGTFPGVRLVPAAGSLPALGEKFTMQVLGLPSTTTAGLLTLGLSKSSFGPMKLPLDLSSIGMKGCSLYNSSEIQFIFPVRQGVGSLALPVPYVAQIKGTRGFLQAFGADRAANASGLVSSNGLEITIGYR